LREEKNSLSAGVRKSTIGPLKKKKKEKESYKTKL